MDSKNLFKISAYLIFLIFLTHAVATKLYWYSFFPWFDIPMHFLGGFWVGLFLIWLFNRKINFFPEFTINTREVSKILLFVLLIGVGWEVFEFFVNDILAKNSIDYFDTTSDLFFDLMGGLCAILYIWRMRIKK